MLGLQNVETVAELQRQGIDDMRDTTTEHGGLLLVRGGGKMEARLYPPLFADNDFDYVTGDKLLRETVTGLAEYHFSFFSRFTTTSARGPECGRSGLCEKGSL